jgi:predicted DNA binding CopG/RHH family protein
MADNEMRTEYDFSASRPNLYAKRLKKQITIRIDEYTIDYFKEQAADTGIPYQSLINLYLSDCAASHKTLNLAWE